LLLKASISNDGLVLRRFSNSCIFVLQPERIKPDQDNPGYNVKSDVWSLGITLVKVNAFLTTYIHIREMMLVDSHLISACSYL